MGSMILLKTDLPLEYVEERISLFKWNLSFFNKDFFFLISTRGVRENEEGHASLLHFPSTAHPNPAEQT